MVCIHGRGSCPGCFKPTLTTVPNSPSTFKVAPKVQLYVPQKEEAGGLGSVPLTEGNRLGYRLVRGQKPRSEPTGPARATARSSGVRSGGWSDLLSRFWGKLRDIRAAMLQKSWTPSSPCSAPATRSSRSKRATVDAETRKPENVAGIKAKAESWKAPAASFTWRKLDSPGRYRGRRDASRLALTHARALPPASAASRVRLGRCRCRYCPLDSGMCCSRRGLFLPGDTPLRSRVLPPPQRSTQPTQHRQSARTSASSIYYRLLFMFIPELWPHGGFRLDPPPSITGFAPAEFPVFPLSCVTRNVPSSQNRARLRPNGSNNN